MQLATALAAGDICPDCNKRPVRTGKQECEVCAAYDVRALAQMNVNHFAEALAAANKELAAAEAALEEAKNG